MATSQFMVFGYDVRDYGRLWLAAWRDLLFGDDSPVRNALDSMVTLQEANGQQTTFQAGQPTEHAALNDIALGLPEDLVLARTLRLPSVAEADLDAALQLEIAASSPFAPDDTTAGWRISRSEQADGLTVNLVIVSRGAVMGFLGEHHQIHDPGAKEVWARSGDMWVIVRGFGEAAREGRYRKRLIRTGSLIVGCALLCLALVWTSAVVSKLRLSTLESVQSEARANARDAMALREELADVNSTIEELNSLSRRLPNPQIELARITDLIPDTAYITQYTQTGRKIRLRGRGEDAAPLQQNLTKQDVFLTVTSPQAISRVGTTGLEQFFLDIELKVNR